MARIIRPLVSDVLVAGTWYPVDPDTFVIDALAVCNDAGRGTLYWPPRGPAGEMGEDVVRFATHGEVQTFPMRVVQGIRGPVYRDPGE